MNGKERRRDDESGAVESPDEPTERGVWGKVHRRGMILSGAATDLEPGLSPFAAGAALRPPRNGRGALTAQSTGWRTFEDGEERRSGDRRSTHQVHYWQVDASTFTESTSILRITTR